MTTSYGDWQAGHLHLGAAELYVVLNGPNASATEVFKLALHELIGRGVLDAGFRQQGSGPTTTRSALLLPATSRPGKLRRPLRNIMDVYNTVAQTSSESANGIDVQDLARALRARHEGKLSQWVTDEVVGSLVEQGLYSEEQVKRLGLFVATSYEPTPTGKAAQALLQASIERVKDQFSSWVSGDRTRAAAFLAIAGPAVLVIPELRPEIERLRPESPGAQKMMEARKETVATIADREFDVYRLVDEAEDLTILDNVIDYSGLERDRASEG